jgi:alpha-N-acetylglucosaminidase
MKKTSLLFLCFFLCALIQSVQAQNNFSALQDLIARRIPVLKGKVIFKTINDSQKDTASYHTQGAQLIIQASTINAASVALNNYLKKYCNSSFSHTGDNIHVPVPIPQVNKTESIAAVYPIRYALNYCTCNYTMSFWTWKDWEKELDWMSLNGVNVMLAPIGTEKIWQLTLRDFGLSEDEIKQFIPGPAFNAWWLMGNQEGWGGPVSNTLIDYWSDLQKKLLARMHELHIEPVLQGFWGMVPSTLKKHYPDAKIIDQGGWCGFQRPPILVPQDALFDKMATTYYKYMKQLYGSDIKYLGGDLFHEGGRTGGLNVQEIGTLVQSNMQKHFPDVIWVLQGWQDNPKPAMMKGLDRSHTLILDLLGDRGVNWEKRNGYEQFPWVWCTVTNYGGKEIMEGKLLRVLTEPHRAETIAAGKTLKGVGIIPEGIENNAIVYDWILASAWQKQLPSLQDNLTSFITSRYGKNDPDINEAWQYLLQSVYVNQAAGSDGGYESILCARPDTNTIASVSSWGPQQLMYDPELLVQAALRFSKAANEFRNSATYQHDLVDIWRQVISLKARDAYNGFMLAFKRKDKTAFIQYKNKFIDWLDLQEKWTSSNSDFTVGHWINKSIEMLPGELDKKLNEQNARMQITYWGSDDPKTLLHEYAYKEWSGILKDLYKPRWLSFFNYAEEKLDGKDAAYPDFFAMEKLGHYNEMFIHLYPNKMPYSYCLK